METDKFELLFSNCIVFSLGYTSKEDISGQKWPTDFQHPWSIQSSVFQKQ